MFWQIEIGKIDAERIVGNWYIGRKQGSGRSLREANLCDRHVSALSPAAARAVPPGHGGGNTGRCC